MKHICFFVLIVISVNSYSQNLENVIYGDYSEATKAAADEKKPLFVYLGKSQDKFFDNLIKK